MFHGASKPPAGAVANAVSSAAVTARAARTAPASPGRGCRAGGEAYRARRGSRHHPLREHRDGEAGWHGGHRHSTAGTTDMPTKTLYARVDGKKPTSPPRSNVS